MKTILSPFVLAWELAESLFRTLILAQSAERQMGEE